MGFGGKTGRIRSYKAMTTTSKKKSNDKTNTPKLCIKTLLLKNVSFSLGGKIPVTPPNFPLPSIAQFEEQLHTMQQEYNDFSNGPFIDVYGNVFLPIYGTFLDIAKNSNVGNYGGKNSISSLFFVRLYSRRKSIVKKRYLGSILDAERQLRVPVPNDNVFILYELKLGERGLAKKLISVRENISPQGNVFAPISLISIC